MPIRSWTVAAILAMVPLLTAIGAATPVFAYAAPSAVATSYYVTTSFLENVTQNGVTNTVAYWDGHNEPHDQNLVAILDFGRQVLVGSSWEVMPIGQSETESASWVETVAEDFAAGWEASHPTYTIVEAIGTNNGDYPWAQSSGNWSAAGTAWAKLVTSVYNQNYARVAIYGANDVESWYGTFGSWVAYGSSTEAWYNAYQNVSDSQTIIDFGSEAADEDSSAWSQQQVYDVAYGGYLDSIVMPEIYGPGQVTDWTDLYHSYPALFFNGITAENGADGTYSWSTAWTDLNAATGGNDVFYWAVNI